MSHLPIVVLEVFVLVWDYLPSKNSEFRNLLYNCVLCSHLQHHIFRVKLNIYVFRMVGDVFGVVKAYTTRVGDGPFPTELK